MAQTEAGWASDAGRCCLGQGYCVDGRARAQALFVADDVGRGALRGRPRAGGISNSGIINHATANGIIVGGKATSGGHVSILSFSGGITNSGALRAGHGIVVGGFATSGSSVLVSNFSGGIS